MNYMNQGFAKKFYTAYTNNGQEIIILASNIGAAHRAARERFGEGVSFSTRESTDDETLHVHPFDVVRAE